MMVRPTNIPDNLITDHVICHAYNAGSSAASIASLWKASPRFILDKLIKQGVTRRTTSVALMNIPLFYDRDRIVQEYLKGKSTRDIRSEYGVATGQTTRLIRRAGYRVRELSEALRIYDLNEEARKFARLLYETPCISLKRKQQTSNRIMQQPLTGLKQSSRGGKRIEFR